LPQDGAAQPLADLVARVTWKRCLFAVQVDLGVLRAFSESRAEGCQLSSEFGGLYATSIGCRLWRVSLAAAEYKQKCLIVDYE
jgi:hypothetical protein